MAQAQIDRLGYFKWLEFPLDAEHYVWIGRKRGQPVIGIFKKTRQRRTGLCLTVEQFKLLQDMMESIHLALSLVAPAQLTLS